MAWLSIRFGVDAENAQILETILESLGAIAVTAENASSTPQFETSPLKTRQWQQQSITGLFEDHVAAAEILRTVKRSLPGCNQIEIKSIEDQDWERTWLTQFKPIKVGRKLWVCPTWLEPPQPDEINIKIDPGLAFGTGTHATTQLCLQALSETALEGLDIIDYGCGSGILAIAALKLGANTASATDIDPRSLQTSRENAALNGVEAKFSVLTVDDIEKLPPAHLVIANILAETLKQLAPKLDQLVCSGGKLWLSGMTTEQAEAVMTHYPDYRFTINYQDNTNSVTSQENWCVALGTKTI